MPDNFRFSTALQKQPITRRILERIVRSRHAELQDTSQDVPLSIVIRNYNEVQQLNRLLKSLQEQIYNASIQIIIQDNGSNDGSLELAKRVGATVASMPQAEFNYPKALNRGMQTAKHEIVIITVAHTLPAHNYWLRAAARHFSDNKVAGVYGMVLSDENSKAHERLFNPYLLLRNPKKHIKRVKMGVLGATNCAIRRSLWQQHPFDEAYEVGAEDTQWARWALKHNYKIIYDSLFSAHHTHQLSLRQRLGDLLRYRAMMAAPRSMKHLSPHTKRRYKL